MSHQAELWVCVYWGSPEQQSQKLRLQRVLALSGWVTERVTGGVHCCLGPQHQSSSAEQSLWQPRRGACHGRPRERQGAAHAEAPKAPCLTPWLLLQLSAALRTHSLRLG